MIIGYARVSIDEQRLDMQLTALREAGCERIFKDHGATGSNMNRRGLEAVLETLNPGDTLVVWRLDRLGRSLTALVKFIENLGEMGCEFQSLNEAREAVRERRQTLKEIAKKYQISSSTLRRRLNSTQVLKSDAIDRRFCKYQHVFSS